MPQKGVGAQAADCTWEHARGGGCSSWGLSRQPKQPLKTYGEESAEEGKAQPGRPLTQIPFTHHIGGAQGQHTPRQSIFRLAQGRPG